MRVFSPFLAAVPAVVVSVVLLPAALFTGALCTGFLSTGLLFTEALGQAVAPPPIDVGVGSAQEIPPPETHYLGREIARTMHFTGAPWLVRESRQREEDCRMLLEALDIRPGQTVCDMGCGNGFYTLELARLVGPRGVVYAVDVQPEMLRLLAGRAAAERLANVRLVLGSPVDPRLPAGSIDLVLCVDVYHEFSHPAAMLARIRESLADGGRLVLAEFRGEDAAVPIKPLHKMTKAQVRAELEPAGFVVDREFDRLPWQHLLFFRVGRAPGAAPRRRPRSHGSRQVPSSQPPSALPPAIRMRFRATKA